METRELAISLPSGLDHWELLFQTPLPARIKGVELTAERLSDPALPRLLHDSALRVVNVTSLAESNITRNIADQTAGAREEFFETANALLKKRFSFATPRFMLDMGLPQPHHPENEASRIALLKRFHHALYHRDRDLLLPVRVPDVLDLSELSRRVHLVLWELMCEKIRVCLNIYPHEIKDALSPEAVYGQYRFELGVARLIYEPETGNHLTENLLTHWLKPLDDIGFDGPVIIAPVTCDFERFEREIAALSDILESLAKRGETKRHERSYP